MPTKTFLNLPEDKKETLLQAARKEFAMHPFLEASINRIILEAKIPRGSFYQYFSDKEDLYFYVFEQNKDQLMQGILPLLDTTTISDFFLKVFDYLMDYFTFWKMEEYYKNVFISIRQLDPSHVKKPEVITDALKKKVMERLTVEEEVKEELYEMLLALLYKNVISVLKEKKEKEQVRYRYRKLLRIIENGLDKEGGEK